MGGVLDGYCICGRPANLRSLVGASRSKRAVRQLVAAVVIRLKIILERFSRVDSHGSNRSDDRHTTAATMFPDPPVPSSSPNRPPFPLPLTPAKSHQSRVPTRYDSRPQFRWFRSRGYQTSTDRSKAHLSSSHMDHPRPGPVPNLP